MKSIRVKDLMVPVAEYAVVSEEATLYEAIIALEEAQKRMGPDQDRHRAVLVLDSGQRVIGKLSQWDVLRSLEPLYEEIEDLKEPGLRHRLDPESVQALLERYGLWHRPLDDICRKAVEVNVQDFLYVPSEGERIEEDASLDQAIHQLVVGHYLSLLVTREGEVVGVLRLADIFRELSGRIKACQV